MLEHKNRTGEVVANWGYLNEMHKNIQAKNSEVRENTNVRVRIAIGVSQAETNNKLNQSPVFQKQSTDGLCETPRSLFLF